MLGQVTFSISYVVIIVRGRLLSIGPEYEEAARDLGASQFAAFRLVLVPILAPAVFASFIVVFALSIDDFVVTDYLSAGSSTQTVPIAIYSNARGGTTTPALNALATVMVVVTLLSVGLAYFVYRWSARSQPVKWPAALSKRSPPWRSEVKHRSRRARPAAEAVRRRDRGRRDRRLDRAGRVLLAARPLGLRQDDDAAADRGLRAAGRAGRSCSTAPTWRRRRRTGAR